MQKPGSPKKPMGKGVKVFFGIGAFYLTVLVVTFILSRFFPEQISFLPAVFPSPTPVPMTDADLDQAAAQFDVQILESDYLINPSTFSYAEDGMRVTLKNAIETDILDITLDLVAWDTNGLPVDLSRFSDSYHSFLSCEGVNLPPGHATDSVFSLDLPNAGSTIACYKVIVSDYTNSNGETIENPYWMEWLRRYDGKKLEAIEKTYDSPQEMLNADVLNGTLSAVKNAIPTALNGETVFYGNATATETGFVFSYDIGIGSTGDVNTTHGNILSMFLQSYDLTPLRQLRDGLQKYCGIESPIFTVNIVDPNGNITYSEDITSDTIDAMNSLGS